jgi:hypothetical protein
MELQEYLVTSSFLYALSTNLFIACCSRLLQNKLLELDAVMAYTQF